MCISAQASFTVAAALVTIGAFTVNKAKTAPMKLFGATPLFFALQQALEGIVWLTMPQNNMSTMLHQFGVYGFLFFALCFWPAWIPGVFYCLEKQATRKMILLACFVMGALYATTMTCMLLGYGATAFVGHGHMAYELGATELINNSIAQMLYMPLYVVATVVPLFVSSTWRVWVLGFVGLIGYDIANTYYSVAFASMWCFIAAIASILVSTIVIRNNKETLL